MNTQEKALDNSPKVCYELSQKEKNLIDFIRKVPYGEITIKLHQGQPWCVESGIVKTEL